MGSIPSRKPALGKCNEAGGIVCGKPDNPSVFACGKSTSRPASLVKGPPVRGMSQSDKGSAVCGEQNVTEGDKGCAVSGEEGAECNEAEGFCKAGIFAYPNR